MFIDYYTGKYRPKKEIEAPAKPEEQPGSAVSNLAALIPLPYMSVGGGHKSRPSEPEVSTEDKIAETPVEYDIPKPRTAFSSFVDHPQEFIRFLEALIQQEDLKKEDKIDLYTTLFEMYLDTANGKKDNTEKQEWQDRAKKLIEGKDVRIMKTITGCMANPVDRYLSQPQTSCFFRIWLTSARAQLWCANKRVFERISFGPTPLRRIRKA